MKINVLNKWSSPSDQAALDFLCRSVADQSVLEDRKFSGDLGDAMETCRRERAAPLLAKMHGQDLRLSREATDLSAVLPEAYVAALADPVRSLMASRGEGLVGIPVGLHRANSLFVSRPVLDGFGIAVPHTLDALLDAARLLLESGVKPFAAGSDPMLLGFLFENLALAAGGARFHQAAFVDCEDEALRCTTMLRVVELWSDVLRMTRVEDRPWRELGAEVKRGAAAFFACGDFASAVMLEDAETTGVGEISFPGTADDFLFIADFFTPIGFSGEAELEALEAIVARWTEPEVVRGFCRRKGALPVVGRLGHEDVPPSVLDKQEGCRKAIAAGTFVPSMTLEQAAPHPVRAAFLGTLAAYAGGAPNPRAFQAALAEAVAAAQKP